MVSFTWLRGAGVVLWLAANVSARPQAESATVNGLLFPSLLDATIDDLSAGLKTRIYTSVDLVNAYISRINEVNKQLHVVNELNPDALQIARQLDQERKAGKLRGPLHGLPILIKDIIGTADKMNNTAGSFALVGAKNPRDATVVAKLRQAGAIILGKANLSQWANFRSQLTSNGWSSYGGQTLGAYTPNQDPSGSSSGPAVGTSIGLAVAALGTETDGSLTSPADYNNVVCIKPTVGLTSQDQVLPLSPKFDVVGPMARTVKDAAYILQAITGKVSYDDATSAIPSIPNYVTACNYNALKGKRIGVPRNIFFWAPDTAPILDAFEAALKIIKSAGATILDVEYPAIDIRYSDAPDGGFTAQSLVTGLDFIANLKTYLGQLTANPNGINDIEDLQTLTQTDPREDYPSRDTFLFDSAVGIDAQGLTNTGPEYQYYSGILREIGGPGGLLGALQNNSLDAVVTPTGFVQGFPSIVGAPVVSVPLGAYPAGQAIKKNVRGDLTNVAPNRPFGISFSGAHWKEADLIGYAYAFEQRTKARIKVKPQIEPKTELWNIVFGIQV